MPLGFARVVHDGASTAIVAACADIFLMVADSPRLDSDGLMTFGFRAVGIGVPGSFATGTARSQYPLCEFFRQLTFQVDCPNAYLPGWLTNTHRRLSTPKSPEGTKQRSPPRNAVGKCTDDGGETA